MGILRKIFSLFDHDIDEDNHSEFDALLPFDVTIGSGGNFRRGIPLITFVNAARRWFEEADATRSQLVDACAAIDTLLNEITERNHHTAFLASMLIGAYDNLRPDEVIGVNGEVYMNRWHLKRDRSQGNVYLHQIVRDDDDRALHCHPWHSVSIVLRGQLREVMEHGARIIGPGDIVSREADEPHRLELVDGPVWSLFITGEKLREWGFHTADGWVHWRDFLGLPEDATPEQVEAARRGDIDPLLMLSRW